ncbi:MAG: class I SAM-dependent methyltransferase [Chlorobi bacterium]|nr:class I SAM-dependent methyltransferase [Chlorobiota bacterium]
MGLFQVKSYIEYFLKAGHYKGHGIHSPFMYELVSEVLWDKYHYYAFDDINIYRSLLYYSDKEIEVTDYGAGSHKLKNTRRKVSSIYKNSAIKRKYGEFLFRLITRYKSRTIVELGTSLGVSTMYLAFPDKSNQIYTIEGCPETAKMAREAFEERGMNNINAFTGKFVDVLPEIFKKVDVIDFLFVDGHHEKDATLEYYEMCKAKAGNNSIFVFDDIHWSKGMEEAWEEIRNDEYVTLSVDLYQLGLVFFCKECRKQNYTIFF